jgi:hypothetical protein
MPVEYFIRFKEKCYDVGTKLKFRNPYGKSIMEGEIILISHNHFCVKLIDGTEWQLSKTRPLDNIIIEIINPVYYKEPPVVYGRSIAGGALPYEDAIFIGWVWYIIIMIVGIIFKECVMIWVFASLIFFAWKNGFFNGGK